MRPHPTAAETPAEEIIEASLGQELQEGPLDPALVPNDEQMDAMDMSDGDDKDSPAEAQGQDGVAWRCRRHWVWRLGGWYWSDTRG